MLREIKHVNQNDSTLHKRWFTDDEFWDLFVWSDDLNEIVSFHLCYSRGTNERAVTWNKDKGFSHLGVSSRLDTKGYKGSFYGSPILVSDGYFDKRRILEKFKIDGKTIAPDVYQFIVTKLEEYTL